MTFFVRGNKDLPSLTSLRQKWNPQLDISVSVSKTCIMESIRASDLLLKICCGP